MIVFTFQKGTIQNGCLIYLGGWDYHVYQDIDLESTYKENMLNCLTNNWKHTIYDIRYYI